MFGFGRQERLKREHSNRSNRHNNSSSSLHADDVSLSQRHLSEARAALKEAESKILTLERSRDGDTRRLWEMQESLSKVETDRDKQLSLLRLDKKRLEAELEAERKTILQLEREWRDESTASEYDALVEEVISSPDPHHPPHPPRVNGGADGGADDKEEKIQRLKHHLARALRRMELLSNRAASIQSSADALAKRLREEYARDLDIKCQDQVKIMNELAVHRLEKDDLAEQKRMEMDGHEKAIRVLEERMEESNRRRREAEEAVMKMLEEESSRLENNSLSNGIAAPPLPQSDSPKSGKKHQDAPQSQPSSTSKGGGNDLERELRELLRSKDEMEGEFRKEAKDRDRMIAWLEEENYVKDRLIRKLQRGGEASSIDGSGGSIGSSGGGGRTSTDSMGSGVGSLRRSGGSNGKVSNGIDGDAAADLHSSQSTATSASASGLTHPQAAEWMNPLDASLMGMSFSVIPQSADLDGDEYPGEGENGAKEEGITPTTTTGARGNDDSVIGKVDVGRE